MGRAKDLGRWLRGSPHAEPDGEGMKSRKRPVSGMRYLESPNHDDPPKSVRTSRMGDYTMTRSRKRPK